MIGFHAAAGGDIRDGKASSLVHLQYRPDSVPELERSHLRMGLWGDQREKADDRSVRRCFVEVRCRRARPAAQLALETPPRGCRACAARTPRCGLLPACQQPGVPISARHIFPPLRLSRTSRMTLHTVSVRPEISDQRELRNALGRFATGVAVITTRLSSAIAQRVFMSSRPSVLKFASEAAARDSANFRTTTLAGRDRAEGPYFLRPTLSGMESPPTRLPSLM